jgi:hypothetical protein
VDKAVLPGVNNLIRRGLLPEYRGLRFHRGFPYNEFQDLSRLGFVQLGDIAMGTEVDKGDIDLYKGIIELHKAEWEEWLYYNDNHTNNVMVNPATNRVMRVDIESYEPIEKEGIKIEDVNYDVADLFIAIALGVKDGYSHRADIVNELIHRLAVSDNLEISILDGLGDHEYNRDAAFSELTSFMRNPENTQDFGKLRYGLLKIIIRMQLNMIDLEGAIPEEVFEYIVNSKDMNQVDFPDW